MSVDSAAEKHKALNQVTNDVNVAFAVPVDFAAVKLHRADVWPH